MQTNRKPTEGHKHSSRTELKHRQSHRVVLSFVTLVVLILTTLTVFWKSTPQSLDLTVNNLTTLADIYRERGLSAFMDAKRAIKHEVEQSLKKDNGLVGPNSAEHVAVYLFPELLDDSHLEKFTAENDFKPLQTAIEESPGTERSRHHFERLRMNVWTYENADRKNPNISATARSVLQLYDTLSNQQR